MKCFSLLLVCLISAIICDGQNNVDFKSYSKNSGTKVSSVNNLLTATWPTGKNDFAKLVLDLSKDKPLFKSIQLKNIEVAADIDPVFILTIGKRDLVSQNGWNIFFDKVPQKPYASYKINFDKRSASVISVGSRTVIRIAGMKATAFNGALEIILYNGSPLFNVAAVMSTNIDSTAILYDAGLISKKSLWNSISWSGTDGAIQSAVPNNKDASRNLAVKYRTIVGEGNKGSLAVFPAPHQYFYPLDEAFNLKFTWYGNNYRKLIPEFGIGIRQELEGDKRFVPWFNAPPGTNQRLNFFCLLSDNKGGAALDAVKKFTHNDVYKPMPGYKTMASHFHNEFIMNVVLAGKPVPERPEFVDVFKDAGIDIVHLGEFHYTAHPKGPDDKRLNELHALFEQCKRLSDKKFLLLPGEEPNEFFGGHWMQFFPKPVYWIMSRKEGMPFVANDPKYGKVYRIANKEEMLKLLQIENGLAWTAHPRTKGSTGFPDAYKNEEFFKSDHFLGAAWKPMPADLSLEKLGLRVLDLMDDMNNWGAKKNVLGEADLFTITRENEMYAHSNVNYLQMNQLPNFNDGWQTVLDAMRNGKFFTTTGEILLPVFKVNGKGANETIRLDKSGKAKVELEIDWTFPLNFVEIISGDGNKVYREKINLQNTQAFGQKKFVFTPDLKNRKWVRAEVWDVAANGAFTQSVWIKE